jgi:hypothetical protein
MNNDDLFFEQIKIYQEIERAKSQEKILLTSAFFVVYCY